MWTVRNKLTIENSYTKWPVICICKLISFVQIWKVLSKEDVQEDMSVIIARMKVTTASCLPRLMS